MAYVIRNKKGKYETRSNTWATDVNKAKVFGRKDVMLVEKGEELVEVSIKVGKVVKTCKRDAS